MTIVEELESLYPDRSEVKQKIADHQNDIENTTHELELDKAQLWTSFDFKSVKSDLKGRTHEFVLACNNDKNISSKEARLKTLKRELKDLENTLSDINFNQREQMIESMQKVASVVSKFNDSVVAFEQAVNKLVDSRKK